MSEAVTRVDAPWLDRFVPVRPEQAFEERVAWLDVPAKGAVYLLVGEGNVPLLLATVGDLRAALKRRLADMVVDAKTKRIDYAKITRGVFYKEVHSPFAANLWYMRTARTLFAGEYRRMISYRAPWWICLKRDDPRVIFKRTTDLDRGDVDYIGPIIQRRVAEKLVETALDLFDLCRYPEVIAQAPHGKACAYKEMGKCPAPCDGSVPLTWHGEQLVRARDVLSGVGREQWLATVKGAMTEAAAKLEFEKAGRIKALLARAELLEHESAAHARPLEAFKFLTLQPGTGRTTVEPFVVMGGEVTPLPLMKKKTLAADAVAVFNAIVDRPVGAPLDEAQHDHVALVAHHLYRGEDDAGVWLRITPTFNHETIAAQAAELLERRRPTKPMAEQSSDSNETSDASAVNADA